MTAESKPKTAWSIINNESEKGKNKNHTPRMFRSGKTFFFQIDCAAKTGIDYFLNVIEKLIIEKVKINSALLSLNKLSFPFLI
jgi:predicted transcriptional regulator